MSELNKIALKIISYGKGILAADESNGTMTKRLEAVKVKSSEENRLNFRKALFTSECMKKCIGGVILYDETIKQSSGSKTIPELIAKRGAITGIKVDTGAIILAGSTFYSIGGILTIKIKNKGNENVTTSTTIWSLIFLFPMAIILEKPLPFSAKIILPSLNSTAQSTP